ncbi:MAG: type II secretion system GspH family protein [Actinomycetia bacterium]|nr:type II secretion system GspH family protein [Actinomycetes bacterium]
MRVREAKLTAPDDGFTMLEITFVVLVIGILAAIALAAYHGSSGRAQDAACRANQRVLESAIPMYAAETSGTVYPDTIQDLAPYVRNDWTKIAICPSDGTSLTYDPVTHDISCPNHP